MESMESELKLLNLLGFKLLELEGYNKTRWNIVDEENNVVGTIQKKKMHGKNKHKKTHAVFGYVMNVESATISCNKLTKINNNEGHGMYDNPFLYELLIKRGEKIDKVDLDLGETPSLTVCSQEYGSMSFSLDDDKLFVNFKSRTEKFYF